MKFTKLVKAEDLTLDNFISALQVLKYKMRKMSKEDIDKNSAKIDEAEQKIKSGLSQLLDISSHIK